MSQCQLITKLGESRNIRAHYYPMYKSIIIMPSKSCLCNMFNNTSHNQDFDGDGDQQIVAFEPPKAICETSTILSIHSHCIDTLSTKPILEAISIPTPNRIEKIAIISKQTNNYESGIKSVLNDIEYNCELTIEALNTINEFLNTINTQLIKKSFKKSNGDNIDTHHVRPAIFSYLPEKLAKNGANEGF